MNAPHLSCPFSVTPVYVLGRGRQTRQTDTKRDRQRQRQRQRQTDTDRQTDKADRYSQRHTDRDT
jgi:hypothetical protein